jgi:predicted naringenin-chalcone synthase
VVLARVARNADLSSKNRNELYIKESRRLSLEAVAALLQKLQEGLQEKITHLITVSCTGVSSPGFDFHIVKECQLAPDVERFHIGFMGCCAAFPAMKLARTICLAEKDARVLLVTVELCSLHLQRKYELDTMVASAIFADGVAAALVSAHPDDSDGARLRLHAFHSEVLPDSETDMTWKIGDSGFEMRLSSYVPNLLEKNIQPVMARLFRKAGVAQREIRLWAIHPGGRLILDKLEKTLNLSKEDLQPSYDVLREYGNMSSSTILFVLDRILDTPQKGKVFAAAFGPGLTVETSCVEKELPC